MKDVSELIEFVAVHFPTATIGEDNGGQIVIYTDLAETTDGRIVPYEAAATPPGYPGPCPDGID